LGRYLDDDVDDDDDDLRKSLLAAGSGSATKFGILEEHQINIARKQGNLSAN
jgi:hypothetical protein